MAAAIAARSAHLGAQAPTLSVLHTAHVSVDRTGTPHVEPHMALLPDGALVVAAMGYPPGGPPDRTHVYRSVDAARSWSRVDAPPGMVGADPWLAVTGERLLLSTLPDHIWASEDGGRTWRAERGLPGERGPFDYTKLVPGVEPGVVHAVTVTRAPIVFSSRDGGRSWGPPIVIEVNRVNHQIGQPAVTASGALLVPFHEISSGGALLRSPRLWMTRLESGAGEPTLPRLVREGYVADSPALLVVPESGGRAERAYLGWTGPSESNRHVVSRSDDGGETWAEPVRLESADAGADGYPTHHPVLAASPDGVLAASWLDARYDPEGLCTAPHVTVSLDGGVTFLPDMPLAELACARTPAHEVGAGAGTTPLWRRFRHGGDYHGIAALPDGSFVIVWADARSGVFQLHSSRIEVGAR